MADISKVVLPNNSEYNIKDTTARSSLNNKVDKVSGKGLSTNDYTTTEKNKLAGIATGAEVNVQSDWNVTDSASDAFIKNKPTIPTVPGAATATPKMDGTAAVGSSAKYAKEDHVHPSDTSKVSHADYDPSYGNGTGNLIMQGRVDYTRPNRLAFLPADQIIVEQTIDGGTTWVDAGVTDWQKAAVFSGVTQANVYIPLLNGARSTKCGIRITFTAMKYDVPSGTAETNKYQYWNSNHVKSTERYCSLDRLWFWLGSNGDTLRIQLYRANGGTPDNWATVFDTDFGATGWSGSDWIKFSYGAFGGGTNQTGQPWNYRLTIFSRLSDGKTAFTQTSKQAVYRIYGYGENCWTAPNSLMQTDHLYSMDANKNATFPALVTATGGFSGDLTGNASGVTTQGNGTTNTARHVWFSDSGTETKRAHDDDFKYNPATNVLTVGNVDGKVNNHTVNSDVPADAKFTDTTYSEATTSAAGLMSSSDKTKLNGIAAGAEANVQSDWNETSTSSDAYIKNKPSIPTKTSDLTNDSDFVSDANYVHTDNNFTTTLKNKLDGIASGAEANVQSDWNVTDTSSDAFIKNKPTIPTKTGDLTNNSNFVSDASYVHTDNNFTTTLKNKLNGIAAGAEANVQSDWSVTDTSSDAYIKNKPTIPSKTSQLTNDSNFAVDSSYVHTDNNFTTTLKNKLNGIAAGAEVNVQSDWNVTDTSSDAYIKNKPTIPTDTWKAFYGTCSTAAATAEKVITVSSDQNFTLRVGAVIGVKFTVSNTASNVKLNVNSTGAKSIWYNTAVYTGASTDVCGYANRVYYYLYDGTYWCWIGFGLQPNSNTIPTAYCTTAAGTAAKAASCTNYNLLAKSYTILLISTTNTAASALTLNINGKGAKPIYINGTASSASNHTMPAGSYLVYYDGTNYYIRTDGKITGDITGDAATVNGKTVGVNVPADAKFTDTVVTKTSELTNDSHFAVDANYIHTDNNYTSTEKTKLAGVATGAEVNVQSDWSVTDTSSDAYIKNKPTIPSKTSQLTNNSNYVADSSYVHTDNNFTTTEKDKLSGIATGAEANVQSDWNETDTTSDAYIKNKPTIPTDTDTWKAYYGTCSTAAATAEKAVVVSADQKFSLKVGAVIGVKFTYTNTASSVKLNVNNTGAKSIWYNTSAYTGASSDVNGYANRTNYYMYDGTYWRWMGFGRNPNSDTYDRTYLSNSGYKAKSAIIAGNIIVAGDDGLYFQLNSGNAFNIRYPILYAGSACEAGAVNNSGYIMIPFDITTTQNMLMTLHMPVYIKGKLLGNLFTPVSTKPLTQTPPETEDGYQYILLGISLNSTTKIYLLPEHPIYEFSGSLIHPMVAPHASSKTTYGLGDKSNYGHVKLSDTYSSRVSGANADGGVGASQNALYNVYNYLSRDANTYRENIVIGTDSVSIETGVSTKVADWVPPDDDGVYLVILTAVWANNNSGSRELWAADSNTTSRISISTDTIARACDGSTTRQQTMFIVHGSSYTSSSPISVYVWQNSGRSLTVSNRLAFVKIACKNRYE